MNQSQKKKNSNWKRKTLIVLCIVLAVILAFTACVAILLSHYLGEVNYSTGDTTISAQDASSIAAGEYVTIPSGNTESIYDPTDITFDSSTNHHGQGEHIVNILLVGQDARKGESRQRSDSMILITFNKSTKTITLTSFLRDSYVQIPGYGKTKLCHAYQYGGMSLLNQTLYNHYGIEIDGNIEVDFSGFEDIIDLLGGVELELTSKEAKKLNELEGWDLKKGKQTLTGEQALLYARIRSIDSDYRRTERQRKVIESLIQEYKNQSLPKMLSLMDEILPLITTNIPKDEIVSYAMELFPMVSGAQIQSQRLPVEGTYDEGFITVSEGLYVWCELNIDFEANREILDKIFEE